MLLLEFTEKGDRPVYINPTQIVAIRQRPKMLTQIVTNATSEAESTIYVKDSLEDVLKKITECRS